MWDITLLNSMTSRISKYEDLYWGDFSSRPDESFDSPAWMELTHLWFSDISGVIEREHWPEMVKVEE